MSIELGHTKLVHTCRRGMGRRPFSWSNPSLGPRYWPTLSDTEVNLYKMLRRQWFLQTPSKEELQNVRLKLTNTKHTNCSKTFSPTLYLDLPQVYFQRAHGRHTALREIYLQDTSKKSWGIDLLGSHCHEY